MLVEKQSHKMEIIKADNYDILIGMQGYDKLGEYINQRKYSKLFILCDNNTNEYCMAHFLANLPVQVGFEIIEIESGEQNKVLEIAQGVIQSMLELGGDRKSAMITLGGGVITDLGGFVASIYMRGIDCFNVPTTLLSMVDASVGGKTGVDCDGIKNCIGTFSNPKMVVVDVTYLETLASDQFKSGYAEMLKHGLIVDPEYYHFLKDISQIDLDHLPFLIYRSIQIKAEVVKEDPLEDNLRKILNFGHTIGHAIESYFLSNEQKTTLLHGQAIAIGMIIEAYMSCEILDLPHNQYLDIKKHIENIFGKVEISLQDQEQILHWLKFDKKNTYGQIKCVLLKQIGVASYDIEVQKDLITKGFEAYREQLLK